MKKFFTFSLSAMAATVAVAGVQTTVSNHNSAVQPRAQHQRIEQVQSATKTLREAPMMSPKSVNAISLPMAIDLRQLKVRKGETGNPYAVSTAADENFINAYYNLGDGVFYPGLEFHKKDADHTETGFYYTGYFMLSQAHNFKLLSKLGKNWALTNSEKTDMNEYVDGNGDLDLSLVFGPADNHEGYGFYGPSVSAKVKGAPDETYWYGGSWVGVQNNRYPDGFESAGLMSGYVEFDEDGNIVLSSMAVYDTWENPTYVGFGQGQYAFGSHSALTESGESHGTIIDAGYTGGGLVVDHLQFELISGTNKPLGDDAVMYVTIFDIDDEGEVLQQYTTEITAADVVFAYEAGQYGSIYNVDVFFNEVDDAGFAAEIAPVINHNLQILIEDNGVNCDYGFMMNADDRANKADSRENSRGETYYMPVTKVRTYLYEPKDGGWYGLDSYGANASVTIMGYHNYLGDNEGNRELVGTVAADAEYYSEDGVEYTWAVSAVLEGQEYNDFDIESTFDPDYWTVEYDEDVVLGFDLEDKYYDQYGIYAFYVAVKKMPEGVTGRESVVTLRSNDEATLTITIKQGEVSDGISAVVADKKNSKAINLMGQKSEANTGLMVKDGKVVFIKK